MDVRRLFSNRAHGLGNRRLDEWRLESRGKDYRDRFRWRNGRSHELGLVGACVVHSSWAPIGIQERNHGTAQHGALYGGNRSALGRVVRF